ncbi:hypothetical protein HOD75_00120 [archaeon]|jgi:hypothetical protein|nr:hypothetical protein [Candidatus Woesearchaeota archaeon]MBT4136057.1 hypothetical protein [archaeon]MBT4241282.1 hypothetical protein [archaeon]MBT4418104.1 hypothetical protein [archaeon]
MKILKKWWFWVVVIVVLLLIFVIPVVPCGIGGGSPDSAGTTSLITIFEYLMNGGCLV